MSEKETHDGFIGRKGWPGIDGNQEPEEHGGIGIQTEYIPIYYTPWI